MDLPFVLGHLGISLYWQQLFEAGFETWEVLKDITEADMYDSTPNPSLQKHTDLVCQACYWDEAGPQKSLSPCAQVLETWWLTKS